MTTFVEETTAQIEERIAVVSDEIERLESARAVLVNGDSAPDPASVKHLRFPPLRSASRQNGRGEQTLRTIAANPGIKTGEIGRRLGMTTHVFRVVRGLQAEGKIVQDGDGWAVAGR